MYSWKYGYWKKALTLTPPPDTHKEGGEEDGGQGDQAGQHHLGGDLRAAAPQDGGEDLEHHPDEEHEVDVGQGQPQQVQHTVFTGGACRGEPTDENSIVVVVPAVAAAREEVEEIFSIRHIQCRSSQVVRDLKESTSLCCGNL